MDKGSRDSVIGTVVIFALVVGGFFVYREVYTDGLDDLPVNVCDGAVDRDIAKHILPDGRSGRQDASSSSPGDHFLFGCRVDNGKSIVSGEVQFGDASVQMWMDHYKKDGNIELVSDGKVEAFATSDVATVYVPCIPQGYKSTGASDSYSLAAEVRVVYKSRIHGAELYQALTDFAYQLTRRAFKLNECQNSIYFPNELPRYKSQGN
jgi:hypothetical protein